VAQELAGEFADGACFVSLAPVRGPDLVLSTIVRTLGLKELAESPLSERQAEYLKEWELLLILDNFEQVVEAAPRVAELLASCPYLKVLTTSREVRHLSSERVFPVPPLALPDLKRLPEDVQSLSGYEAVAFFVERARAAKPDFRLSAQNAAVVAEICARLDGLLLGIQLAAARIKLLSSREILDRFRRRLRLLKGGTRDAPARQKTLRDAIDWSYDLLGEEERPLFRRLSVFAGGCTLEAAEAVCDPEEGLAEEVLDILGSLMDKSLLRRAEPEDGERRFLMLQTVREYALERLQAEGEEEQVRRAQAAHYLALVEEVRPPRGGSQTRDAGAAAGGVVRPAGGRARQSQGGALMVARKRGGGDGLAVDREAAVVLVQARPPQRGTTVARRGTGKERIADPRAGRGAQRGRRTGTQPVRLRAGARVVGGKPGPATGTRRRERHGGRAHQPGHRGTRPW
jgi:predicted ATPase